MIICEGYTKVEAGSRLVFSWLSFDEDMKSESVCKHCGSPGSRHEVQPDSRNDWNRGRPYTVCDQHSRSQWVCWEDKIGVADGNPACNCGRPSRQDRMGNDTGRGGLGFWTCAEGRCQYYSEDRYGRTYGMVQNFLPWLL